MPRPFAIANSKDLITEEIHATYGSPEQQQGTGEKAREFVERGREMYV
jgi:hypothetical protein